MPARSGLNPYLEAIWRRRREYRLIRGNPHKRDTERCCDCNGTDSAMCLRSRAAHMIDHWTQTWRHDAALCGR